MARIPLSQKNPQSKSGHRRSNSAGPPEANRGAASVIPLIGRRPYTPVTPVDYRRINDDKRLPDIDQNQFVVNRRRPMSSGEAFESPKRAASADNKEVKPAEEEPKEEEAKKAAEEEKKEEVKGEEKQDAPKEEVGLWKAADANNIS